MFGNLAKLREMQIIRWAMKNPDASFTTRGFLRELYKDDERFELPPQPVIEAYATACRDLQRKQILKGLGSRNETERFTLNDLDYVEKVIEPFKEEMTERLT